MNKKSTARVILAIQLFKLYNTSNHSLEWIEFNLNQILTSRQTTFAIFETNNRKVGITMLTNRLSVLNGKIPLDWLNNRLDSFKVKCKKLLLLANIMCTPLHKTNERQ